MTEKTIPVRWQEAMDKIRKYGVYSDERGWLSGFAEGAIIELLAAEAKVRELEQERDLERADYDLNFAQLRKSHDAYAAQLQAVTQERGQIREALEDLYDAYENGDPCTEGGEPDGAAMGNCVSLGYDDEERILALIPKQRSRPPVLPSIAQLQARNRELVTALEDIKSLPHRTWRVLPSACSHCIAVGALSKVKA